MTWDDLDYWDSKDWITVQERLDVLDKHSIRYNPSRELLFAALDAVRMDEVKVVLVGQDPYPSHTLATGIAYSIPPTCFNYPTTLHNVFLEYCRDLGHPYPSSGNLQKWSKEGVLLWNAIPSCLAGRSLSHDWPEWASLTREIVQKVPAVFVFMGHVAKRFVTDVPYNRFSDIVLTAHPCNRQKQFRGCRLFSTVNSLLVNPVDWKLT